MPQIRPYVALRNYALGKISKSDLINSDPLFSYMQEEDRFDPSESVIRIAFKDSEEFHRMLGLDNDDAWLISELNNPYSSVELYDIYSVTDQFYEGYGPFDYLDEENTELLTQISRLILPMKVDFGNERFKSRLADKLHENFKNETKDLIYDYWSERNAALTSSLQDAIPQEMKEYYDDMDFEEIYKDGFDIKVKDLLKYYIGTNLMHRPVRDILSSYFKEKQAPGGWMEDYYQYEKESDFDDKSYNRSIKQILEKILEKIENSAEGANIDDFTEMTSRVTKKFKQDEWYVLPKDPKKDTDFKILGFDFPEMKVRVSLRKGLKQTTISLSEDNFYNLLYQPTLFKLDEI